jgi:CBS domain-containing membrane protein
LLGLPALATLLLALTGSLLLMGALRCLHPPGAALALCLAQGQPDRAALGVGVLVPVLRGAAGLLGCALLFNRRTGVRYPKAPVVAPPPELVRADVWAGITAADLQLALEEFGEFVDVTAEDLEEIVRRSERYALQRSLGEAFVADGQPRGGQCA